MKALDSEGILLHTNSTRRRPEEARIGFSPVVRIAIVGLGPWGLASLERIIDVARRRRVPAIVHVIEPGTPGSGIFGVHRSEYLPLNTPCGQHVIHPTGSGADLPSYAVTLYEWAQAMGYKWVGDQCRLSDAGTPITPHDFLPRTLMGEWLEWSYKEIVAAAPPFVTVLHHPTRAVDIEAMVDCESIKLAEGGRIFAEHVLISTGHTPDRPRDRTDELALEPYPVESLNEVIPPRSAVAVAGLGLVALDVIAALTVGRGGHFERLEDGRLRYEASGDEPSVYLYSRTGLPYASKPAGAIDPTGSYTPVICTPETITRLRRSDDGTLIRGTLDFRRDLLPLLVAEMRIRFHRQSALLLDGSLEEAERVTRLLASAWNRGTFEAAVAEFVAHHGTFDFESHLLGTSGSPTPYLSSEDYQRRLYKLIEADVADATTVDGRVTPVKAAFETLRILRDVLRSLLDFQGLTIDSYEEFQSQIANRMKSAVAGPPVRRCQELLALMDCGIVQAPCGPSPTVEAADTSVVIRSTQLAEPRALAVDFLVRGYLLDPTIERSQSSLINHLQLRGRIRPLQYGDEPVGSIDLTEMSHPIGRDGTEQQRLWVFGALTEGVRYFTQYVPSPKSRVRAFLDTEDCAQSIFHMAEQDRAPSDHGLETGITTQAG